ncbi:MAG: hypothetical protein QOD40_3209 [Alphaproteobacteria bacterium]|jgi:hypothetical protein|nr:hypothetical protein [Alphaproteobacteria bacterium]
MAVLNKFLRRYTNIPSLLYILREHKITLLDPETWDDQNDSHYLSVYREKKSLQSVLALCFTQVSETYHHWKIFADGSAGICITFVRKQLVAALEKEGGVTMKTVGYLTLNEMGEKNLKVAELPFLKRYPYENECEFRVIYESKIRKLNTLDVPISLKCIDRITLSPWTPRALANTLKETIREIPGCDKMRIMHSTLISNERWKSYSEDAH